MPGEMLLLFGVLVLVLIGIVFAVWRYWDNLSSVSPEEEAYDKRVASLNERQANRFSDDLLTHRMDEEDAWQIMVARGQKAARRRNRYGGNLSRRARERRRP